MTIQKLDFRTQMITPLLKGHSTDIFKRAPAWLARRLQSPWKSLPQCLYSTMMRRARLFLLIIPYQLVVCGGGIRRLIAVLFGRSVNYRSHHGAACTWWGSSNHRQIPTFIEGRLRISGTLLYSIQMGGCTHFYMDCPVCPIVGDGKWCKVIILANSGLGFYRLRGYAVRGDT